MLLLVVVNLFDFEGFLFVLLRTGAERLVGSSAGGKNSHLLLQLYEKHLGGLITARCLEALEVTGELVAGELLLDLGH